MEFGQGQQQGMTVADVPTPAGDGALGRKDSLIVLRKRMQDKEVNEPSNININTLLGVFGTFLLTVLLIVYIVAGGTQQPVTTSGVVTNVTVAPDPEVKARADIVETTTEDAEDFTTESTDLPTRASKRTRRSKMRLFAKRATNHTRATNPFNSTYQEYDTT